MAYASACHQAEALGQGIPSVPAGFNYEAFLERFWRREVAFNNFYRVLIHHGGTRARPWQTLPASAKKELGATLSEQGIYQPCRPSLQRELQTLWTENQERVRIDRRRYKVRMGDEKELAAFGESIPVQLEDEEGHERPPRCVAMAITVDYGHYSDAHILSHLATLIQASRPPKCRPAPPVGKTARGRKTNDYRAALDRLAIMRLLHRWPPSELRRQLPDAWRTYGGRHSSFGREIRLGLAFFRRAFTFLPQAEKPRSYERSGRRRKA